MFSFLIMIKLLFPYFSSIFLMERIMNEENEWDQNVKAELVEGPVERVSREEVVK